MMRLVLGLSLGSALLLSGCRQDGPAKPDEGGKPDTGNAGMADEDGDGWVVSTGDCDDNNAAIHPGAEELCDGLDNDCDGLIDEDSIQVWYQDGDGDGYGDAGVSESACEQPDGFIADATDCDDTDATIHPLADEDCDDPVDRNCDGSVGYADADGDGSPACEDCDDQDAAQSPEAAEICDANNVDEDCDGLSDDADPSVDTATQTAWYTDVDSDGYGDSALVTMACDGAGSIYDGDCNDADPAYNPGAPEVDCADPNDYNCDGSVGYADSDGDGYAACEECDDSEPSVNPGGTEVCNGVDDDCNGVPDDNATDATIWYRDLDGDGYGDPAGAVASCVQPASTTADDTDCDDGAAGTNPGAPEYCDGIDNDCDGTVDEDGLDPATWYTDADSDGYGDAALPVYSCLQPAGAVADDTDCDDSNAIVSPAALEICDGIDNDCDGVIDDNPTGALTWYQDADADGYGDDALTTTACTIPSGYSGFGGDCDDTDPAYNPGAVELDCLDPNDYNCDGSTGYSDLDGDGYAACVECDDTDALNYPGADEYCDGVDNDCDGQVDDDALDAQTWYLDADTDGYGSPNSTILSCQYPAGYLADNSDCNDGVSSIHPGAPEYCDGIDQDCDGSIDDGAVDMSVWYTDSDGDGYGDGAPTLACTQPASSSALDGDCDDADAAYNPGAAEPDCADPNDYNCDGAVAYRDSDLDGVAACEDCDDSDDTIYPGADEYCDGVDNDCDGTTDEDSALDAPDWYADADGDSYGSAASVRASCSQPAGYVGDATDCDDAADTTYPGATEICDSVDNDCDGAIDDNATGAPTWYYDNDGDTYGGSTSVVSCTQPVGTVGNSGDCNDSVSAINPGAAEICDSIDNNCDGTVDTDATDRTTWYVDGDSDGYGSASGSVLSCTQPAGYVSSATDCNDSAAAVNPAAVEACNSIDDDCDGQTDEAGATGGTTWYVDVDRDGYGSTASQTACTQPAGYVATSTDCNDAVASIYPGATEVCNSLDDDCDGAVDDGAVGFGTWYRDADSDGYGNSSSSVTTISCSQPSGYVAGAGDCNDAAAAVNPGATEACNSIDDDCDGSIDEGAIGTTWYVDSDRDGYGNSASSTLSCSQPVGYVGNGSDCNDASAAVSPAAVEACNGIDDDCDGATDEAGATGGTTWYRDADSDGYGGATTQSACTQPAGYVASSTDCADSNAAINPGATELCNSVDDDCDGATDEAGALGASTWYRDGDSDGYGGTTSATSCTQPVGYVSTSTDCADSNAAINPGAAELCNSTDDDCDGSVDEGTGTTWYRDADGDGYGSTSNGTQVACTQPAGYVATTTDCNDGLSATNPGAAETCNSIDDDCDGTVDEGSIGTTWYRDADSDTYGSSATTVTSCTQPAGYVASSTDCEDAISSINPGASDVCDTIDNDCDGYADNDGLCPCVVLYYNSHPYMFCTSAATWTVAEAGCTALGYDLVSINNAAENTWVVDRGYIYYRGKWWTGGNDLASEGTWTWDSGDAWSYTNWHAGEPNDSGNEDCMQLGRFLDYTWNDEPCNTALRYVCEGN